MTIDVSALVERATVTLPEIGDLLKIYKGYTGRPAMERARMKRMMAFKAGESLLNTDALFSLPEARDEENRPVVAFAPMSARQVKFFQDDGVAGFHASDWVSTQRIMAEKSFIQVPFRRKQLSDIERRHPEFIHSF